VAAQEREAVAEGTSGDRRGGRKQNGSSGVTSYGRSGKRRVEERRLERDRDEMEGRDGRWKRSECCGPTDRSLGCSFYLMVGWRGVQ